MTGTVPDADLLAAVRELAAAALATNGALRPIDVAEAAWGLDPSTPAKDRLLALRNAVGSAMSVGVLTDVVADESRADAATVTVTAGQLADALRRVDGGLEVIITGWVPGEETWFAPIDVDSWRGSYDQLALHPAKWTDLALKTTVGDLLGQLGAVLDAGDVEGYKGGTYAVGEDTPVWIDQWGMWSPGAGGAAGRGITAIEYRIDPDVVDGRRHGFVVLHAGPGAE